LNFFRFACLAGLIALMLSEQTAHAQLLSLSSGFDARYLYQDHQPNSFVLRGAFLNLRQVFSDSTGDRVMLVIQFDFEDNFTESHFYNTYLHLKGPLGKVNLKVGRYIVPFGLLAYYDTERLLIQTLDPVSLGIKTDVGAQLFGFYHRWDYAISLSNGAGQRWSDLDNNKLMIARFGSEWDDLKLGLSYLNGKILAFDAHATYKNLFALDAERYSGAALFRIEGILGTENQRSVRGGFFGFDYALTPSLELNSKYAIWKKEQTTHFLGLGFSYQFMPGIFFRVADRYQHSRREHENVFAIQFYAEFRRQL
jgi:hypothetical protein